MPSLKFKLETPLVGSYNVSIRVKNALTTIGLQNDTIYFVENGIYKSVQLKRDNFTGNTLATYVEERMNSISIWANNYTVTYDNISNKFVVMSKNPFMFGSDNPDSLKNSCQNKIMGFYDNNNSIGHTLFVSDTVANLNPPTYIGVNILEAYATIPNRNNNVFSETCMRARLSGDYYIIELSDDMNINVPKPTRVLTVVFPDLDGGTFMYINTNDIELALNAI